MSVSGRIYSVGDVMQNPSEYDEKREVRRERDRRGEVFEKHVVSLHERPVQQVHLERKNAENREEPELESLHDEKRDDEKHGQHIHALLNPEAFPHPRVNCEVPDGGRERREEGVVALIVLYRPERLPTLREPRGEHAERKGHHMQFVDRHVLAQGLGYPPCKRVGKHVDAKGREREPPLREEKRKYEIIKKDE